MSAKIGFGCEVGKWCGARTMAGWGEGGLSQGLSGQSVPREEAPRGLPQPILREPRQSGAPCLRREDVYIKSRAGQVDWRGEEARLTAEKGNHVP